ncbi:MAG: hypothetical protein ABL893_11560 [Hyphomicrobium sp.]|nr:hypothetical protein [Hyphomicrobium sp.]
MKFYLPTIAVCAALAVTIGAPAADAAPKAKIKASQPLKGVIYGKQRRIGYYSYKYSDVISPGSRSNPAVTGMHESGAIDSDFFFPRPSGPFGGYTPYMR